MIRYLDGAEVERMLHLAPGTIRQARYRGTTPPPDAMTGNRPGWLPETIHQWDNRPTPRNRTKETP